MFRKLTEELSSLLEKEGMLVRPYSNPGLQFFQAMPEKQQLETISGLRHYLEASKRVRRAGRSLKDAKFFVDVALEYYGFVPHPDFEKLAFQPDVVIEFYSMAGMQLFRTFNYFEFTSYTLEDIYCRQWMHLYERPDAIVKNMFEDIEQMLKTNDLMKTLSYGAHTIKERVSLERLEVVCEGIHVSALSKENQVVGLTSLVTCRPFYMKA
jgi:hypothetical protein